MFIRIRVIDVVTLVNIFFFNLEILPLPSHYILSLLLFIIKNRNQFMVNSDIYHIDTRQHAFINLP